MPAWTSEEIAHLQHIYELCKAMVEIEGLTMSDIHKLTSPVFTKTGLRVPPMSVPPRKVVAMTEDKQGRIYMEFKDLPRDLRMRIGLLGYSRVRNPDTGEWFYGRPPSERQLRRDRASRWRR